MIGAYSSRESLRPHSVLSLNNGERAKELGLRRSLSSQGENTKRHISQQCSNQHISSNSNNKNGSLTHQGEQKKSTPHPQGGHLGKNDYLGTGDQMLRNLNQHRGDQARGTFAATFCQNVLSKAKDATGGQENVFPADGEKEGEREKDVEYVCSIIKCPIINYFILLIVHCRLHHHSNPFQCRNITISCLYYYDSLLLSVYRASGPPNMIVHVCDDAKKRNNQTK